MNEIMEKVTKMLSDDIPVKDVITTYDKTFVLTNNGLIEFKGDVSSFEDIYATYELRATKLFNQYDTHARKYTKIKAIYDELVRVEAKYSKKTTGYVDQGDYQKLTNTLLTESNFVEQVDEISFSEICFFLEELIEKYYELLNTFYALDTETGTEYLDLFGYEGKLLWLAPNEYDLYID